MESYNMKDDSESRRKEIQLTKLLSEGWVSLIVDMEIEGVIAPPAQMKKPECRFDIGYDMPTPIRDLEIDSIGWSGTLQIDGRQFWCSIPWDAVMLMAPTHPKTTLEQRSKKTAKAPKNKSSDDDGKVVSLKDWKAKKGLA